MGNPLAQEVNLFILVLCSDVAGNQTSKYGDKLD